MRGADGLAYPYGYPAYANWQHPAVMPSGSVLAATFLVVAAFGYYSFSPILQLLGTGSEPSIIYRAAVLGLGLLLVLTVRVDLNRLGVMTYLPFLLFTGLYLYRMYDNYFVSQLPVYIAPSLAFSIFIGAGIIPAFLASLMVQRISDRHFFYAMLVLAGIFLSALAFNFNELAADLTARATLEKANAISLTGLALTFLAFSIFYISRRGFTRPLVLALIPLMITVVLLSKSRGPIVSFAMGFVIYWLISRSRHKVQILFGVLAMVVLGLVISQLTSVHIFELVLSRFEIQRTGVSTAQDRLIMWAGGWEQFKDDPLFGRYMFETIFFHYPHNIVIESLIATGIVGALLLFVVLFQTGMAALRIARNAAAPKYAHFFVFVFFKELFQAMFSGAIWGVPTLWIAALVVIATGTPVRPRQWRQPGLPASYHGGNAA